MTPTLVDITGLAALSLNIAGLVRTSDRSLRHSTGWASALWAANNLLMGAQSAAALSALSVGRQVSASNAQGRSARTKLWSCLAFLLVTLLLGALTWNGVTTLFSMAGSMLATYAMFYMRGVALRLAMIGVASLWMYNAWAYDSWWQMLGNTLNGVAAAYGAWRAAKTQTTV
ncbi:YgjV family protein [Rhodoferax sp. BLA1]|uniref:YgjV family protein n=1 Tax=Rhodoferax sp. BLA1 TaxID=2576062 RepID=UPI0015D3C5F3|nr:YgjV family protein [Rhodoferax sp. BLA1]